MVAGTAAKPAEIAGHFVPPLGSLPFLSLPMTYLVALLRLDPAVAGGPHPPPPGVSMRTTSPARTRIVHLSGRGTARDSSPSGSSQFSPGAPDSPPKRPHARLSRRSVISDTVQASRTSRSR